MKDIIEYYKLNERSSTSTTPTDHQKNIINNVTPMVTKASVDVADYIELNGDEKTLRQWMRLTGDAQIALLDMVDFIKKNIK